MKKKVLLINPPSAGSYRSEIMLGDSLALAVVSGELLKYELDVKVVDCFINKWDFDNLKNELDSYEDISAIGITVMCEASLGVVKKIVEYVNSINTNIYFFVGGYSVTLSNDKYIGMGIDTIVVGDDVERMEIVANDILCGNRRKDFVLECPLVESEFDYDDTNRVDLQKSYLADHIVAIETSKGCYGKCKFCTIFYQYNGRWVPRSESGVKRQLRRIKKECDCTQIRFVDANFLGAGKRGYDRILSICKCASELGYNFRIECRISDIDEVLFVKLKELGLCGVFLGIENASQINLDYINKGITKEEIIRKIKILQKLGISYSFGFMMITPCTDMEIIQENIQFLKEIKYGIRWKHLFNSLIIQKEGVFDIVSPVESYEMKIGYKCNDMLCCNILRFNEVALGKYKEIFNLEHYIGIAIERGKEGRDSFFWELDEQFSDTCLEIYSSLVNELFICNKKIEPKEMEFIVEKYMFCLREELIDYSACIKKHGVVEETMLKSIKEFFVNEK